MPRSSATPKQAYLPSTNILNTKWLSEEHVSMVSDFFPVPKNEEKIKFDKDNDIPYALVRTINAIRGTVDFDVEIFPAFDYAREKHTLSIEKISESVTKINFDSINSEKPSFELLCVCSNNDDGMAQCTFKGTEFLLLKVSYTNV